MNPARILIVDDSEMNRDTLQGLVEALGYEALLAENGSQALEILRTPSSADLVVLDILMPGMSGYEVLVHVKQDPLLKDIPVIMVSVVDEIDSVLKCIEAGADDYLTKPFNALFLKARLNSSLQKKFQSDNERRFNTWLAESYQKLQQAEEARDALFKMIVHDIKNPLTSILGEAELMAFRLNQGRFEQEQGLQSVHNIQKSVHQINGLVRGILDVAKMEAGQFAIDLAEVNLNAFIREEASLVAADLTAQNVGLLLPPADTTDIVCLADRSLLKRIIQNLITNCLKYGCTVENPSIRLDVQLNDDLAALSVSDNGPGIDPEHLQHIFTKFYQVDSTQKGLGLGLSFCRMAAMAMKGRISALNNPEGGLTVTLFLPLADRDEK